MVNEETPRKKRKKFEVCFEASSRLPNDEDGSLLIVNDRREVKVNDEIARKKRKPVGSYNG